MADWVKMAIKAGVIVTVTTLVIVILTQVTFPGIDLTAFANGVRVGRAIIEYWFPYMSVLYNIFVSLLLIELASMGIYIILIAIRWVLKVNE